MSTGCRPTSCGERSNTSTIAWPFTPTIHATKQSSRRESLPRIPCPALLIAAEAKRGAIVTPEIAAALRVLVPHLQVVCIPNAGHNIRRDQFGRSMSAMRDFLAAA